MENNFALMRVLSGVTIYNNSNRIIYLKIPDYLSELLLTENYCDIYQQARFDGIWTQDEMVEYMVEQGMWTKQDQNRLDVLPKEIEDLKESYYIAYLNFKKRDFYPRKIKDKEEEYTNLAIRLHQFDEYTCEGVAKFVQILHKINCIAYYEDGSKVWPKNTFLEEDFQLIMDIAKTYTESRLNDDDLRQLSKDSEWRSIWSTTKNPSLIFTAIGEEQRGLISWTQLYDSVRGMPDCPDDTVLENDNLMDGWLIYQNRHKGDDKPQNARGINSPHNEVFIVAENPEDIKRIGNLNDNAAQNTKRRRLSLVQKHGSIEEQDFPDSRLKILELAQQKGVRNG